MTKLYISFVLLLSFSLNAQQIVNQKFGKGFYNIVASDSSFSMKLGIRVQSLYTGEWKFNDTLGFDKGNSQFLIRRARLKFDGYVYNPKIQYKIELGLSNKDMGKVNSRNNEAPNIILDAVVKWNFYKNFTLWAGQTKLPGNRERVISSSSLQFVDRSMLNSEFNIDRDMGAQLNHHFKFGKSFIVKEKFSISQGEGRNVVQKNLGGLQYTSRIEFLPFGKFSEKGDYFGSDLKREVKPKFAFGFTYDFNDRAVKNRSNQGSYMSYDLDKDGDIDGYFEANTSTIFADFMFKYKSFSVMGEYAIRDSKNATQSILNDDLTTTTGQVSIGKGLNIQIGYLFKNNWEIAGRYTQIVPDSKLNKNQNNHYTIGLSKFIVGHKLKVQTDMSYGTTSNNSDSQLLYRLQFELHF